MRRLTLLVIAATAAAFSLSSAVLAGADSSGSALGPSLAEDNERAMAAERARQLQFEIRRASPDARAERARSRAGHAGLGRDAAIGLARQRFGDFLSAPLHPEPVLAEGDRLVGYASDDRAIVERANGERVVARSLGLPFLAPAAGGGKDPVDLSLQERGDGFVPANPLVPVSIASSGELQLEESGVGFRVLGESEYRLAPLDGERLFAENVQTDTDLIAMPSATGASVALQVRSAAAPEEAALAFDLPAGAHIRAATGPAARSGIEGPGSLEIVRDGEVLAEVLPPAAWDAEGAPVEASYVVDGDQVRLVFPHRDKDLLYPLLVDPTVAQPRQDLGNFGSTGAPMTAQAYPSGSSYWWLGVQYGAYLSIWNLQNTFNTSHYGQWVWTPGSSWTIAQANFQGIHFTPSTANMCLRHGLWNPGGYTGSQTYCSAQSNTHTANFTGSGAGNYAVFSMVPNGNSYRSTQANGITQWVVTYLKDQTTPSLTINSSPIGWLKPANAIINATGTDTPIGMDKLVLTNQNTGATLDTLNGGACNSSCQSTLGGNLSAASAGNGTHTLRVYSYDAHANTNYTSNIVVNVDGQAPTIPDPSGSLWANAMVAGDELLPTSYGLTATANDSHSKMKRLEIRFDGAVVASTTSGAGGVGMALDWTLNAGSYANGLHTVTITAYDQLDQASNRVFHVDINDRTTPNTAQQVPAYGINGAAAYDRPPGAKQGLPDGDPATTPDATEQEVAHQNYLGFTRVPFDLLPIKGTNPDYSRLDELVATASNRRVQLLPILTEDNKMGDVRLAPAEVEFPRFAEAAARVAQRYGPNGSFWSERPSVRYMPINVWEIWNEPNHSSHWWPTPDADVFGSLFNQTQEAIRGPGGNSDARVLYPGLVHRLTDPATVEPFEFFWDSIAMDTCRFDAISVHPYGRQVGYASGEVDPHRPLAILQEWKNQLDSSWVFDVELWVTEVGWSDGGGSEGVATGYSPDAARQNQSVSSFLQDVAGYRQQLNIGPVLYYHYTDQLKPGDSTDFRHKLGLFSRVEYNVPSPGTAARPAWWTYRDEAEQLSRDNNMYRSLPPQRCP